jgi:23S rRNA (guanosine2251-2'-O)-methyltransferase
MKTRKLKKAQDSGDYKDRPPESDLRNPSQAHPAADRLYGVMPIVEALRSGRRAIQHIAVVEGARHERLRELLDLAGATRVPVRRVSRIEIDRTFPNITHQGVVAKIAAAHYADADDLLAELAARVGTEHPPLALALDGLEDPRNLGAVLRTAECAGVQAVFTTERRAVGLTETVAKASAGALEYISVARVPNLARLIEQVKERKIWVVGAAEDAERRFTEWDWTQPTTIFLGSEGKGLHRLVRERCDLLVRIPVFGRLESLNVSVAAGVILYEAVRQRTVAKKIP